jgi:AhpD family alkylhydroperoxidase
MNKPLTEIEPAYEHLSDFAKATHGTAAAIQGMRQKALYADGALPAKFKALGALLWSISARCEPCVKYYALKSREMGASEEELGEICAVASTMGGCVGETWALKAFAAYRELGVADEACCSDGSESA